MASYGELYRDYLDETHDTGQYSFALMLERAYPRDYAMGFQDFVREGAFLCFECGRELRPGDDGINPGEDDFPQCEKCREAERAA